MSKQKSQPVTESQLASEGNPLATPSAPPPAAPAAAAPKAKRTPEEKAAKWRELANVRFAKARKILSQLAALGNRSNYVYTEPDVDKLVLELRNLVIKVGNAHDKGTGPADETPLF